MPAWPEASAFLALLAMVLIALLLGFAGGVLFAERRCRRQVARAAAQASELADDRLHESTERLRREHAEESGRLESAALNAMDRLLAAHRGREAELEAVLLELREYRARTEIALEAASRRAETLQRTIAERDERLALANRRLHERQGEQ
ncbi:hypothetical protein [Gulosibacter sp. 10]|uniref:hypothetical protein n=1 Tax=Gulosibacter sp. 10 TaxID=1255570 RepID=UPI00097E8AD5|nr:hypothetical protein [Gulosibacter sp. 10]SJM64614.1 hypothetical protein FM112_10360 [Gulosibacter sp. 10]